jgi:hypothetical protein
MTGTCSDHGALEAAVAAEDDVDDVLRVQVHREVEGLGGVGSA